MKPDLVDRMLSRSHTARIAVIGDVMLDTYTWGRVDRISPEAPVPIVEVVSHTSSPGGAANAAVCIAALGASVTLFGTLGDDTNGNALSDQLAAVGVRSQCARVDTEPTITKHRIWAGSQQLLRVDAEHRPAAGAALERLQEHFDPAGFDAVLVSDYGKGVIDEVSCPWVIEAARAAGVPVVVDPKSFDFSRYRGASIVKPNEREAQQAFEMRYARTGDTRQMGEFLTTEIADAAVITRGADGLELFRGSDHVHLPVQPQSVYDVTGAGDVVAAVLTLGVALRWDLIDSCRLANASARVSVSRAGTGGVTRQEIVDDLAEIE